MNLEARNPGIQEFHYILSGFMVSKFSVYV